MSLKKTNWLKYLFVTRNVAETEQEYWNEKRKRHLAHEHSEGVVKGLAVTETSPPSLTVEIAAGRALDTEGNDPEVESPQQIDCAGLVPGSGEVTAYITLRYNSVEVEPYFVDELGAYQNKYVQDTYVLEATTQAPSAPQVELARFRLGASATEITNAADPDNPGLNEIDLRQVNYSGKEVLALVDLSDVDPDEAEAFNNMNSPSASNPIATELDVENAVAPVRSEVQTARGSRPSLDGRLDVMLNEDGSFKGITEISPAAPLTGGGIAGDVPIGIADATPTSRGALSAADKAKLDGIEAGATADQTEAEILTALKTVDGAGSGLDADTVDGKHANELTVDPATINHNQLNNLYGGPAYFHLTSKQNLILTQGRWKTQQLGAESSVYFAGSYRLRCVTGTAAYFGNYTFRIHLEHDGGESGALYSGGTLLADWNFQYIPNPAWIRSFWVSIGSLFQSGDSSWWVFRVNWLRLVPSNHSTGFWINSSGSGTSAQHTGRHWDLLVNFTFRGPNGYSYWGAGGPEFCTGNIYFSHYRIPQT
ncbi:MAG: hypothetical protein JRI22_09055 [Deltaproteobacteria bacterium]|nr:hypothetical protein [Deltaproteobacteria bacterium]